MIHHGENNPVTRRYKAWANMMQRCYNSRRDGYKNYGGRGIKVCERWHKFENFRDDIGPHPGKGWSLDRPKNDEDYGPNNWQWATRKMQSRNRRATKLTWVLVEEIKRRLALGETRKSLGDLFGVHPVVISEISLGKIWLRDQEALNGFYREPIRGYLGS